MIDSISDDLYWYYDVVFMLELFLCSNNAQHQVRDEKGQKGWRCF